MEQLEEKARAAVENLLFQCAEGEPGDTLLIVHEKIDQNYYDANLHWLISEHAKALGFLVRFFPIEFDPDVKAPTADLIEATSSVDHTLFIARLGDQIRFRTDTQNRNKIISYAIDSDMLASQFGIADYKGFEALKVEINNFMMKADAIHVTCPAGSDFFGYVKDFDKEPSDVTIKRFPMSIFSPLPAVNFSGCIAQNGFLVGTGSQYYSPYACELKKTLFIDFSGNEILDFRGDVEDITTAKEHYNFVAKKYGVNPYYVHSWHAGMHPSCSFKFPASKSFERWSGAAFGNPRLLHFHTCGEDPPGEISLNIVDPTISVDDKKIWDNGRLHPERLPNGKDLIKDYPSLAHAFANPAKEIGLGENGVLSFK